MSAQAISYALGLLVVVFALAMVIIGLSIMDRKADVRRLRAQRQSGGCAWHGCNGSDGHTHLPGNPVAMPQPARHRKDNA